MVCLSAVQTAAGQSTPSQSAANPNVSGQNAANESESAIPNRVTQSVDGKERVTLKGNVHPFAQSASSLGATTASLPMERILLVLKRSDAQEAALGNLVEAQQDKSSPNYHKWLSPEDFGKQFGPSDSDIQAVTDWLGSQGFRNVRVTAGRNVVEFSGNAGSVRQAFHVQMENFEINGAEYAANTADPQIPVALAPVISGIVSLHNFPKRSHLRFRGDVQKNPHSGKLQPLFTYPDPFSGDGNFYGVGPGDFATIYNTTPLIAGGNDGTGQTIAVVGETQINPKDVSDFRAMFGLPSNFTASNIILNGSDPGITSMNEESESDLDVQWSGAVAPGAKVQFVVSASTTASAGIDLSALYIIEHNLADVMSESYGACEKDLGTAGNDFYRQLWEQAAAQGITVVVSSGDGGSAGCDDFNNQTVATRGLAVSGLAGTPFNVSVGGTDFNQFNTQSTYWNLTNESTTGTSAKGYIPEFPWNENCSQIGLTGCGASAPNGSVNIVAGSGGASSVYAKPTWQMGVTGVPSDNHRDQPDISLFASPGFEGSGYLFCQADLTGVESCDLSSPDFTFHVIGGTSASAPAFAGVMALVNQYAAAHGGTSRQGNANVGLYALAKKAGASCTSSVPEAAGCIFNDVAKPNIHYPTGAASISVPCKGATPNCSAAVASATGVLVDPAHTTVEAWTAGAGYDLATGLGSLNVNNLATSWTSVSTVPTTTTFSLTPTTGITHGQNENVAITVNVKPTSGTGIASGDVAILAVQTGGATLGVDQFTLANGAITAAKTQNLPGGTYKIYAHYAGDGTNAPSDSAQVQVAVDKEASQTFIVIPAFDTQGNQTSTNASSVVYGSNYIIRMYVANSAATANSGSANFGAPNGACFLINEETCPTGNVGLSADGTAIDGGTFMLNSDGYTRDIAPTLTGGMYPLVAKYSGDSSYNASTSATDNFTVSKAQTASAFDSSTPTQLILGSESDFFVNTTSQSFGVAPTGSVILAFDGAPVTPDFTNPTGQDGATNGQASLRTGVAVTLKTQVPSGMHTLTATYVGDANYATSTTTGTAVRVVNRTKMSLTADTSNVIYPAPVTLTATISSLVKNPTISATGVHFASQVGGNLDGNISYTVSTDASGNTLLKAVLVFAPQFNGGVIAYYDGDANFQSNQSDLFELNVTIPDYQIGPSQPTVTVSSGQTASTTITFTPTSSASSSVQLQIAAGELPPGLPCALVPTSVQLSGGKPSSATVSCSVPATTSGTTTSEVFPLSRNRPESPSGWGGGWSLLTILSLAVALTLFLIPKSRFRRRLQYACVLLSSFSLVGGCGGGGGNTAGGGGGGSAAATVTSLSVPSTTVAPGANLQTTVKVTGSGSSSPSGTVMLVIDAIYTTGSMPLVGGQATISYYLGPIGGHSVIAKYSGDSHNLASQTKTPLNLVQTGTGGFNVTASTGPVTKTFQVTVNVQ